MNLKGAAPEKFGALKAFFYRLWAEPSIDPMHCRIAADVAIDSGKVLDLGCGGGKLAYLIAAVRPGVSVVGLDSSEPMIQMARKRWTLPNLEFRAGNLEAADASGEFDLALTVLSFHHWEEPEQTLAAVHRALVPGGQLWIYEMDPEAPAQAIRSDRAPLWGFFRIPVWMQRRMARDHGFTAAELDAVVRPVVEKSPFGALRTTRAGSTARLELVRGQVSINHYEL